MNPRLGLILAIAILYSLSGLRGRAIQSSSGANAGEAACSQCHSAIVASYSNTAMAHASGPASQSPITGSFVHQQSGVAYRVYEEGGKLWLEFKRANAPALDGRRELLYYIGSGRLKGRTYLSEVGGFLFESPINWYAEQRVWDMTPNYHAAREAPLNLPAFPECLNCHTSGMQTPELGTANRYPQPPFTHSGVTCERCHGSAADHVTRRSNMLQLANLPAERRDAICMQCHLEGDVAIQRPRRHAYEFRPGDNLLDFVRYFVFTDKQGTRAVSQFEALAQSGCKRASGDKMSCTSCHDPHSTPAPAEKVEYFRSKCLACHGAAFGEKHHSENRDCVQCHMPALPAKDISHTQATDHRILRRPAPEAVASNQLQPSKLEPFPASMATKDDARDLGLAYETIAARGNWFAAAEAERLLALSYRQDQNDAPVLSALGYIAQHRGDLDTARQYYEAALRNNAYDDEAATNLGVLEARNGHLRRAVELWQGVFQRAPWRSPVGVNIALGFCSAGKFDEATLYVKRVLQFNPDFASGRTLLSQLAATPPRCSLTP